MKNTTGHYILADDGKSPIPVDNEELWARWFEQTDRRVASWYSPDGKIQVSTVFLGLDHNIRGDKPLLFETMTFGMGDGEYQERYSTFEEAINGHERQFRGLNHF